MATKIYIGSDGDWGVNANWSPSGVPVDDDDVILQNNSDDIASNLNQSSVCLTSLTIYDSFTGTIGTSTAYLQIGADVVYIGKSSSYGTSNGASRINLDLGTDATTVHILSSATSGSDTGFPPVRLLANNAATVINATKGIGGLACGAGETSTISALNINDGGTSDVVFYVGSGVTVTTITKLAGSLTVCCAATTLNSYGDTTYVNTTGNYTTIKATSGTTDIIASGTITTLSNDGATVYPRNHGTITNVEAKSGNTDFLGCAVARTVTNMKLWAGATLKYDPSILTLTNGVVAQESISITAA